MPKAKSVLFTGISGSLRKSVTFRDTTQTPDITMQTRPVPTDRRTAKQAVIRDAYSRLAFLWKNLSHLDKEPYEIMAEARNLTPWNCWLSFHLPLMRRNPLFYTSFAEGAGTTLTNFAIGGTAGNINGPVWTEKNNFPVLSFDGVDDIVSWPNNTELRIPSSFVFFFMGYPTKPDAQAWTFLGDKNKSTELNGTIIYVGQDNRIYWAPGNGTAVQWGAKTLTAPKNQLFTLGLIVNPTNYTTYQNGIVSTSSRSAWSVATSTQLFRLGSLTPASGAYKGQMYISALLPAGTTAAELAALDAHYRPFFT